ncbi:antibiotic biosynthesis monooxygenase [Algoriphagus confluentis]|uniref:Antibiotic biosynthesis monooxygenase n=1 Tax=Algoriphagus confluentis TaxID=1697556 RepID=A0ABQ6PT18_9BACT|nr:antibiotic biosynthesis monooxygenase [Algoriphagus confluentis]
MIAKTPSPPYFAVIFTSLRTEIEENYQEMATWMVQLAEEQEGYLGHESAREEIGITVSYWKDLESIRKWKTHSDHLLAQKQGKEKWYSAYKTRIAFVEKDYGFEK